MPTAKKRPPRFRVGDKVVFLYGPQKVTGEIVEDRGLLGEYGRRLYRVRINFGEGEDQGTFEIPEEDLEIPTRNLFEADSPGMRQEFDVTYRRVGNSNHWIASTRRGKLYKGVRAKGAISYTTPHWEGQHESEERLGRVAVLLECDQPVWIAGTDVGLEASPGIEVRARVLADQMFKSRHPEAIIEHESLEGEG
jgi:hypothetical protein